ncbi:hypothetical protein [Cohnella thailandensis]|uniref:DUF3153 domain-containing protein n=1 Tax=Cohnella thailandensis TaxID=557557 RepID=A0A841T1B1_9BACL|nr:hypothetical protein [Cohnella thailandensis]MBB6634861.1 hypothetical protein [Cohnella thailandensis]MBP1975917.1 hypothetical protein [Cohnella thailandensis]
MRAKPAKHTPPSAAIRPAIRLTGRRRMAAVAVLLLACLFLLTSCVQGQAHLKINRDATADLHLNLAVSSKALDLIGKPELLRQAAERVAGDRMAFKAYEKDGQQVLEGTRHFDLKEMRQQPMDLPEGVEVEHSSEKHFFYTKYHVAVTVDTDKLMEGSGGADSESMTDKLSSLSPLVKKLVLSQLDFDLKVTFPLKPGANNAPGTEDGGRTLVWPFSFTEPNRFELDFNAPNLKNILIVGAPALLVILGGGVWLIVRRRRSKRGKPA